MSRLAEVPLQEVFAEAAAAHERASFRSGEIRRVLRFAGRQLELRFAGAPLAEALLGAMRPRIVGRASAVGQPSAEVSIGLWAGDSPMPWHLGDLGPRGLVRGSSPEGVSAVYEAGSGALTLFDSRSSQILYRVPDINGIPWWERAAPLRPALHFGLAGSTSHLVHAGAVGIRGRGGVLLAGSGGSGKTTLALSAVEHGLGYVGDDYVLLEDGVAWNLYRTAKLDNGPGREKTVLEIDRRDLVEALPVRAVVVPVIGAGRVRLTRISAGDALLALAPSTAFQIPFDRGVVLATLAELVRRVPSYRLLLGSSPGATAAALVEVVAGD
jgi:hypothetical protein